VRGIVVRSRSIFGTIGAGLQTLVGGNITLLTNLRERTRQEAFDLMLQHAAEPGRQRSRGCALRRDRGDARRHRSAGVWDGCGRRTGEVDYELVSVTPVIANWITAQAAIQCAT
jgi:hypothetical protein